MKAKAALVFIAGKEPFTAAWWPSSSASEHMAKSLVLLNQVVA
ncbi:MAG: hypothetical protein AB9879_11375 [Methanothrix sp.]